MLKKNELLNRDQVEYAKFEVDVMKDMKHPHLLGIDYVIQNPNEIFLVLPFSEGGDLNKLYKKEIRDKSFFFLKERMVLFWAI